MSYRHPWLGVEVRHLATFVAVARTRSFRQAAGELGYVQSAVSQQISTLETVVGARLVERRRGQRMVTLTPAGERLLDRSVGIIAQLRAARVDIAAADQGRGPTIRLAVASDVAADVVTCILRAATDAMPKLRLRVMSASGDELVGWLDRGTADIAVGARNAHPAFATATLVDDPFVLLMRPDSRLAARAGVASLDDLAGERLIVPEPALADAHLRAAGLRLDRALHVPRAAAVPALVRAGSGTGLIPRSEVPEASGLVALSTAGLIAPRRIVLCWHAARRRAALLEEFAAAAVRALATDGARVRPAA